MSDIFDDLKKLLKKDVAPILGQYFKDPNNQITDNFNDFLNNPQTFIKDMFENFSKNKDSNKQEFYTDIETVTNIDPTIDDEYDDLLERLILIQENMIQIEKILKEKN